MIAGHGHDPQGLRDVLHRDPVGVADPGLPLEERGFRTHGHGVVLHVLGQDVHRRAHGETQALALSLGVAQGAFVGPEHVARGVQVVAGLQLLAGGPDDVRCEVAVGDEADVLGFVLLGIGETVGFGQGPGLLLGHAAQGEPDAGQLFLGQLV